ncbi:hypothetical protein ACFWY6_08770 [Streptomyces sp. NPDC059037]|uniref:SGM_3592 family protein n=1 Tax=Streptomyces sp. NPDC059037 TaxID=3346710 RepID=UPI0036A8F41B
MASEPSKEPSEKTSEDWDEIVLDEDFIRSAGTAEPSARARMLSARWRQSGAPEPHPWRSDEPPAGWLFSRARRRWRRRRR